MTATEPAFLQPEMLYPTAGCRNAGSVAVTVPCFEGGGKGGRDGATWGV